MKVSERLARLIDVKSIISITVIGAATYGFCAGKINASEFLPIAMAVITYFFTRKDNGEAK